MLVIGFVYFVNYLVTPCIVGERLEVYFRPRLSEPFRSELWRRASSSGDPELYGKRYRMVDNLIRSKLLVGASESGVKERLGPPESSSQAGTTARLFYFLANQKQYPARSVLFPGAFANLDRWMLEIELHNGTVTLVKVYFS